MNQNRDKKFVGGLVAGLLSLIGAGVSAGIGAGNARKQRAAQEEALREQQREQNEMDNLQRAQELSNKYANQDLDYMYDRISYDGNTPGTTTAVNGQVKQNMYKNGGMNKVSYTSLPVKRCGDRRKAQNGITYPIVDENYVNSQIVDNLEDINDINNILSFNANNLRRRVEESNYERRKNIRKFRNALLDAIKGDRNISYKEGILSAAKTGANLGVNAMTAAKAGINTMSAGNDTGIIKAAKIASSAFKCGGRKKTAYGYYGYNPYNEYDRYGYGDAMKEAETIAPQQATSDGGWTQADTNAAVGGALSTVGSILNSAVNARQNYLNTIQSLKRVKRGTPFSLRRRTPQDEEYTY